MSFLNSILSDLREKRLWPVALVLLAALVAVPFLLSGKSSSPGASAQGPPPAAAPQATALPAVSVKSGPGDVHLTGHGRDPFPQTRTTSASAGGTSGIPSSSPSGGAAASGGTSGDQGGAGSGAAGTSTTPSSGSSDSTSSGSTTTTTTTTTTPNGNPSPAPSHSGLTDSESYDVALGITNAFGGFDTTDPVRLSALPSDRQALLVELGVLKGGHRVLFVVQPGAVLTGPGTCIPGPSDCQILSLAPRQTEALSMRSAAGVPDEVAQLAVTAIRVERHRSAAAAAKARRTTSAFGRSLLAKSTSMFLSLFQYQPSLGVVLDRRSLTVEGS